MGPGCITIASGLARASFSRVRPYCLKYSCADGSKAPRMRSFCSRSMMITSTSRRPSRMSVYARAPMLSMPSGTSVRGPITRRSGTPRMDSAWMSERATRECITSPTTATRRRVKSPFKWRIVYMSSRPCVGCECRPSPALMTLTESPRICVRCCAIMKGAPLCAWRTMNMSASIAARLSIVSSSDSPFEVDDVLMLRLTTSADRRLAAISNVVRVRVEFSKNRLNTDLPRSSGTFLTSRSDTPTKLEAVSRMRWIISRDRPSIDSRWRSSPSGRSWGCSMVGSVAPRVWQVSGKPQREAAVGLARELEAGVLGQVMDRPAVAGLDRQLAPAPVDEHCELDAARAAVVEELVQGRAHRAAGIEDVVHQDDVGPAHVEGQVRLAR